MTKFQISALTALKVAGHIGLSALVAGIVVLISHDPKFFLYTPLINPVLSAVIKYFSLDVPNVTIDSLPDDTQKS